MGTGKILTPFYDLKEHAVGKSGFFFLEHLLKARADLHLESGGHECDQELNIYIAGLLNSLVRSDSLVRPKPYISPFDTDVRQWLAHHPGLRNAYMAYRENADFGLVLFGIFSGYEHEGSYHRIVMADRDEQGRIALYYELAASALGHLQGNSASLIEVFETLSEHLDEILRILHRAAHSYFDLMERMSEGSLFHLERELDEMDKRKYYGEKLDEFLKCYTDYREQPSEAVKERLFALAEELKKLNVDFKFDGMERKEGTASLR
ncbi:MAG: hypothetical protein JXA18_05505 [Chitinispirillaceae bacterium]|nr:hypothetical protein [Chitinispirillaceae bacterium]